MYIVTPPAQGWGETPRKSARSPIHRRRAHAGSFITAYLLLSRTASANPPEQCATFARSINLSRDFPQATLDRGDAFGTVHSNKAFHRGASGVRH